MKRWYRRVYDHMFGAIPTGATDTDRPGAEARAAGEDQMLTTQIEIHREVTAEALEEERRRLELAEIEARTKAEFDAIFAPVQDSVDSLFDKVFDQAEKAAGLGAGWCYGWYVDAVRIVAEAERFARDVATGDIYRTQELDMRVFRQQQFALAALAA